ncbi:MAG: beta-ketoacyl synthase N-terminal-like domain-containing protein [Lepagella sp.]
MSSRCFLNSIAQVSCQSPLSEEWWDAPSIRQEAYVRAVEPSVKDLIPPAEARRMCRILKRAIATSIAAIRDSGLQMPDAIITGTGMGCMENSEKFLIDISKYGECCLKPTLFMQSTHNTISSLIAIRLGCHGYNNTYSQKSVSFESALLDAWLQIRSGEIASALVGSHDEVTPLMEHILRRSISDRTLISEASVAAVISNSPSSHSLCEVADVRLLHRPDADDFRHLLQPDLDDIIILGVNGSPANDDPYLAALDALDFAPISLRFKHIFGENYSASAIAFHIAALILQRQSIPHYFLIEDGQNISAPIRHISILNHSDDASWSLVRLKSI